MARTKASVGAKLSSGKSSKARNLGSAQPTSNSPSTSSSKVSTSGNPYCPRPTPDWQSPITRFFIGGSPDKDKESGGSFSAKRKKRHNVITSDTESDEETASEKKTIDPVNGRADQSISEDLDSSVLSNVESRPISPDPSSHKIVEYFESKDKKSESKTPSNKGKGKGKGKKSSTEKRPTNGDGETKPAQNGGSTEKENLKPKENVKSSSKSDERPARSSEKRDLIDGDEISAKRSKIS